MPQLYWNTVSNLLRQTLLTTMNAPQFNAFRLVGGTALSLQIGHRISVDIDLFTDATYGTVDFEAIEQFFRLHYPYVDTTSGVIGLGTSYFVGQDDQNAVKVDIYYTDPFIRPELEKSGVRLAVVEEIIAMKLDVISRGGRKKDFWDIHALIQNYSLEAMLQFHEQRYPYSHDRDAICRNIVTFEEADNDFDPACLRGEHWELIKYDLQHWAPE